MRFSEERKTNYINIEEQYLTHNTYSVKRER